MVDWRLEGCGQAHVGLIDILGYKSKVRRGTTEDTMLRYLAWMPAMVLGTAERAGGRRRPTRHLRCLFYADSILLYSFRETDNALATVVAATNRALELLFISGMHARAAVTTGQLAVAHFEGASGFGGKALVRAHELESRQDWCGGILDPRTPATARALLRRRQLTVRHAVPMKDGGPLTADALRWPTTPGSVRETAAALLASSVRRNAVASRRARACVEFARQHVGPDGSVAPRPFPRGLRASIRVN